MNYLLVAEDNAATRGYLQITLPGALRGGWQSVFVAGCGQAMEFLGDKDRDPDLLQGAVIVSWRDVHLDLAGGMVDTSEEVIKKAAAMGLPVMVWTVDPKNEELLRLTGELREINSFIVEIVGKTDRDGFDEALARITAERQPSHVERRGCARHKEGGN